MTTIFFILYSTVVSAKMAEKYGFVMKKIAGAACVQTVSKSQTLSFQSSKILMSNSHASHAIGWGVVKKASSTMWVFVQYSFFYFFIFLFFIYLFLFLLTPVWFLQGFTLNGAPILDEFLKVKGTFETASRATTRSPPAALIHLRLESLDHFAHFNTSREVLREYYKNEHQKKLKIVDIPFNLGDDQALASWKADIKEVVANLSGCSHVVVFVTTHSDPNSGDLWLGYDKSGRHWAAAVGSVSTSLFYHFVLILT